MPSSPAWNGQLNHVLLGVGDQKVVELRQVLLSMLRALHVVRAVLQEVRWLMSCAPSQPCHPQPSKQLKKPTPAGDGCAPAALAINSHLQHTVRPSLCFPTSAHSMWSHCA